MTDSSVDQYDMAAHLCGLTLDEYHKYCIRTQSASYEATPMDQFGDSVARKYGPSGAWSYDLAKDLTFHAHIYLTIAAQHLRGLQILIVHSSNSLPWGPAARGAAEASGRVLWLLDNRLALNGLGARKRVARSLLDNEENLRIQKRLAYAFKHPDRAKDGDAARRAKNLVRKPGLFYKSEIKVDEKSGQLKLCDEALPGPSKFVRVAAEMFGDDLGEATGHYGYMSAMAHPTIFAFIETLSKISSTPNDSNFIPFRQDGRFALTLASNTTRAFYNAWRTWISWTDTGMSEADIVHKIHCAANERHSR